MVHHELVMFKAHLWSPNFCLQVINTNIISCRYLSALISQSFLDIGSVSRILDGIMKLCLQFCWKIENQENSTNTTELDHITEEFNKKSNSLYTILRSSRLAGSQRAPFLRRFLLRLNFNSFFEVNLHDCHLLSCFIFPNWALTHPSFALTRLESLTSYKEGKGLLPF